MNWYVVHVRQGREQATADKLACTFGLTTYCPEIRQRKDFRSPLNGRFDGDRHGEGVVAPFFPGYIFVQWSRLDEEPQAIDMTPECGRLVRAASAELHAHPISLPFTVIEWLQTQLASPYYCGFTMESKAEEGQLPVPLPGLEAALNELLSPRARVAALLQAIGVDTTGEDDDLVVKRPRRTRGHGRKIHY